MQNVQDKGLIEEVRTLLEKKAKGSRATDLGARFQASWEKAMVFENSKGNKSVGVPIQRNLPRDVNPDLLLSEYLLVNYDGEEVADTFILQMVTERNKSNNDLNVVKSYDRDRIEGFTGKLVVKQINTEISEGRVFVEGKATGKVFGNKKIGTLKNARVNETQCWEVYLITYYNDGTTTEQTLYYFCVDDEYDNPGDGESGGGPGGEPDPEGCTLDLSGVYAASQLVSESFVSTGSLERTKLYVWKAVIGPTYSISSNDVGVHRRVNTSSPWKWYSLSHSSLTLNGTHPGISISPTTAYSNATLGEYWANMALKIDVTFSIVCHGFPAPRHLSFYPNINNHIDAGY